MIIRAWRCDFDYKCEPGRPHGCAAPCGWRFIEFRCDGPGCDAAMASREAPGARQWFFKRNGECWCPRHIPAWVPEWRARQKAVRPRTDSIEQGSTDVEGY